MDVNEDGADWNLFFSAARHFTGVPDSGLRQLIIDLEDFPDALRELYWAVIDRELPDACALLDRIENSYRNARQRQLERELEQLIAYRRVAFGAEVPSPVSIPSSSGHPRASSPPARDPWYQTAATIRNAEIDPDKLARFRSTDKGGLPGFRDISPLAILGYRAGNTNGLSDQQRWEFLTDFVLEAELPRALDRAYLEEWCEAKSVGRLEKTLRHISSLISIRERSDSQKYAQAIRDWRLDLHRLQTLRGRCR